VNRTQFQYFPDGKLEKIIQPGGAETIFQHDLAGMKETITDPVGTQTVHSFDAAGRVTETEVKDPLENRLSKVVRGYDTATTLLTVNPFLCAASVKPTFTPTPTSNTTRTAM